MITLEGPRSLMAREGLSSSSGRELGGRIWGMSSGSTEDELLPSQGLSVPLGATLHNRFQGRERIKSQKGDVYWLVNCCL